MIHQVCEMYMSRNLLVQCCYGFFGFCVSVTWKFIEKTKTPLPLHDDLMSFSDCAATFRGIYINNLIRSKSKEHLQHLSPLARMLNHHVLDFFICEQHEELVDLIQQHFCFSNFRASALTAVHCLVNSIIRQKFNSGKFCLGLCIYIYLLYTQDTMPFKGTSNLPTIIIDPFWWYLNTLSLSHFPLLFSYFWVVMGEWVSSTNILHFFSAQWRTKIYKGNKCDGVLWYGKRRHAPNGVWVEMVFDF